MHKIILLILYVANVDNLICWNENRKLTINDFKKVDFLEWSNIGHAGEIHSHIVVKQARQDTILEYKVYNCFEPDSSWMMFCDTSKNVYTIEFVKEIENKQKTTGLNHEQKHFDLNEIYARKIRRMFILNCTLKNINNISDSIDTYLDECERQQDIYDKETAHSVITEMQKKWDVKIQKMLVELDNYKEPEGQVILR